MILGEFCLEKLFFFPEEKHEVVFDNRSVAEVKDRRGEGTLKISEI